MHFSFHVSTFIVSLYMQKAFILKRKSQIRFAESFDNECIIIHLSIIVSFLHESCIHIGFELSDCS